MNRRVTLLAAVLVLVGRVWQAGAAAAERPNILLAIADDASYPHMGAYGCTWVHTPTFDRVAREGLLFTRAYTPNAKCAPSRACILTGRNSWQLKAACNHVPYFPVEFPTYAEVLSQHGYFVGMTVKGWAPGVAQDAQGQDRLMAGQPFNRRTLQPPTPHIAAADYAGNFADFLAAVPPATPWCFWYGSVEPHRAYEFGSGVAKGHKSIADIDRVSGSWPDNETVRNDLLDYAFELEYFDSHLAKMLQQLEQRGELANTVVVVTSDNGMPFPRVKGQEYERSNHLPLAIMWKGGIHAPGRTIDDYVSFIDLAPTFIELAGLDWQQTGLAPATGQSLTDIFFSDRAGQVVPSRDHVLIGKERHDVGRPHDQGYPIRGIVKSGLLYLHNFETSRWPAGNPETGYLNCDGSPTKTQILDLRRAGTDARFWKLAFGKRPAEELYNVEQDPECLTNLAADPQYAARMTQLHTQLLQELQDQADPRVLGEGHVFDEYPYASAAHKDFYERYMRGEKLSAGWVTETDFEPQPLDDLERP
ncbi:MAG: sulfatase family protein [Pirellulaceae bacterium]